MLFTYRAHARRGLCICVLVLMTSCANAEALTVGIILTRGNPAFEAAHAAFMAEIGTISDIGIILQNPLADPVAWSNAARKLAASGVDVIVAYGSQAALAVKQEAPRTPMIYVDMYEPLVKTMDPKKSTGTCTRWPMTSFVRHVKETAGNNRIGIIYCGHERASALQSQEVEHLLERYGIQAVRVNLRKPADVHTAVSVERVGYYVVTSSSTIDSVFDTLLRMAGDRKIPVASLIYREEPTALLTLASDPAEHGRLAASKLRRIARGSAVRDLETRCATSYDLTINMKAAQSLSVRVPMQIVTEATEVIQ